MPIKACLEKQYIICYWITLIRLPVLAGSAWFRIISGDTAQTDNYWTQEVWNSIQW
jgi:hypothetical protein